LSNDRSKRVKSERDAAVDVIKSLREHGHIAYLAGGCVRDILLGHDPKDFDVATDAHPQQIEGYFKKTASVGAAFGVMLVRDFGYTIEVASFRSDGVYSDARRPDSIEYSSPQEDAKRRDFTINALFMDPLPTSDEPEIIDFVNGLDDVRDRVLRAVGDPNDRLKEDHLRALRAVRFAAKYELSIDPATSSAIEAHAKALSGVSVERVGEEVKRMLADRSRSRACVLIDELQLDDAIFNDVHPFDPACMESIQAESMSYAATLVTLAIGRGHAIGNDSELLCQQYRQHLDLSNTDRDSMRSILELLRAFTSDWDSLSLARKKRLASREHASETLVIYNAVCQQSGSDHAIGIHDEIAKLKTDEFGGINPDPFVTGGDLVRLGYRPGPDFKSILDAVYDAQLEGHIDSKNNGIELAKKLAQKQA
jgi:poly(A) polymerase